MYQKGSKQGVSVDQNQIEVLEKAGWTKTVVEDVDKPKPTPAPPTPAPTTNKTVDKK